MTKIKLIAISFLSLILVDDSSFIKRQITVQGTVEDVLKVMTNQNMDDLKSWHSGCEKICLINKLSDSEGIYLWLYERPSFLLLKILLLGRVCLDKSESKAIITITPYKVSLEKINSCIGAQPYRQAEDFLIKWTISPDGDGKCIIEHSNYMRVGYPSVLEALGAESKTSRIEGSLKKLKSKIEIAKKSE